MTLLEQVWGTPNERIHTVGASALLMSLVLFLCFTPLTKPQGLIVFYLFGAGCCLIGVATSRNAWARWRTGEDTLILLRKRDASDPIYEVTIHLAGRAFHWAGPLAHVDVGAFSVTPIDTHTQPPTGSAFGRGYQMFRAIFWAACSSILFQAIFGVLALAYGIWISTVVFQYMFSNA